MLEKAFVVIITIFTFYVNSHAYPTQGCSVFQYASFNGAKIGKVEFGNDNSGSYRLTVNMSAAVVTPYINQFGNIKLELRSSVNDILKGNPLVYFIYFPSQTYLPKPTRIEFNGRVYCNGITEPAKPGVSITNFWAHTFISTGVPQYKPEYRPETEYKPAYNPYPETEYKPAEVDDNNNPAPIDILHIPDTPSINNNNKVNTNVNPIQHTTPRISDDPHTTFKSVQVVSTNSTRDCVNTTSTHDDLPAGLNNQNTWSTNVIFKNSSYSYRCKEVHVTNTNTHTVAVSTS